MWQSKCVGYCISYELNGGEGGPSANPQKGDQTSGEITLDSYWPTRANYGFIGWCTKPTSDRTCSGEAYTPGNPYSLENGNDITLYGMWAPVTGNMQDFSCNSLSQGEVTTLKDTRDSNIYTVAKLKDGRCWMTQNLRIVNMTITSQNSNTAGSITLPTSNDAGFSNSCTVAQNDQFVNYLVPETNKMYGAYYKWVLATAGYGTKSHGTQSGYNSNYSICPKNFKLPTRTEAENLVRVTTYDEATRPPYNFIFSGGTGHSGNGAWWTQTSSGDQRRNNSSSCVAGSYTWPYHLFLKKPGTFSVSNEAAGMNGITMRCLQ